MMSMSSTAEAALPLWTHEPASRPDRARIRARIAGMHCSLCTGTIEKALGRHPGVEKVAVSLTHEQALVEYDPRRVQPQDLLQTLKQMGYTLQFAARTSGPITAIWFDRRHGTMWGAASNHGEDYGIAW